MANNNFIDAIAPAEANLNELVAVYGSYTAETEGRDTTFCNCWGNPLPSLPTVEQTWAGDYVLMCTETQFQGFKALELQDCILDEGEHNYLEKVDIDAVLVFREKAKTNAIYKVARLLKAALTDTHVSINSAAKLAAEKTDLTREMCEDLMVEAIQILVSRGYEMRVTQEGDKWFVRTLRMPATAYVMRIMLKEYELLTA